MLDKMIIILLSAETYDGVFEPDHQIDFIYDPNNDGPMEDFTQREGKKRWEKMHHEVPTVIYYRYEWVEADT